MAIEFVIDAKDRARIQKMLSAETAQKIGSVMFRAFQQAGAQVANRVIDNVSWIILKRPTGRLAGSIGSHVEVIGDQFVATIGSGEGPQGGRVPYAGIHEYGGTIRPKNGQYLTIPTDNARTLGGDTKGGFTARNLFNGGVAGFSGAVIIGKTIYGIMQGQKNKLMPLFTLVKSVDIPARRYLSKSLEQEQDKIPNMIITSVAKQLEEAANGN
jgi:phage gpG-like protein